MSIIRSTWIDDDGTGTFGTVIKDSELQTIYTNIDTEINSVKTGTLTAYQTSQLKEDFDYDHEIELTGVLPIGSAHKEGSGRVHVGDILSRPVAGIKGRIWIDDSSDATYDDGIDWKPIIGGTRRLFSGSAGAGIILANTIALGVDIVFISVSVHVPAAPSGSYELSILLNGIIVGRTTYDFSAFSGDSIFSDRQFSVSVYLVRYSSTTHVIQLTNSSSGDTASTDTLQVLNFPGTVLLTGIDWTIDQSVTVTATGSPLPPGTTSDIIGIVYH